MGNIFFRYYIEHICLPIYKSKPPEMNPKG